MMVIVEVVVMIQVMAMAAKVKRPSMSKAFDKAVLRWLGGWSGGVKGV